MDSTSQEGLDSLKPGKEGGSSRLSEQHVQRPRGRPFCILRMSEMWTPEDDRDRVPDLSLVPRLGVDRSSGLKMLLVECEVREGLSAWEDCVERGE